MKTFKIICQRASFQSEPGDVLMDWKYGKREGGFLFLEIGTTTKIVGGDKLSLTKFPIGTNITFTMSPI